MGLRNHGNGCCFQPKGIEGCVFKEILSKPRLLLFQSVQLHLGTALALQRGPKRQRLCACPPSAHVQSRADFGCVPLQLTAGVLGPAPVPLSNTCSAGRRWLQPLTGPQAAEAPTSTSARESRGAPQVVPRLLGSLRFLLLDGLWGSRPGPSRPPPCPRNDGLRRPDWTGAEPTWPAVSLGFSSLSHSVLSDKSNKSPLV